MTALVKELYDALRKCGADEDVAARAAAAVVSTEQAATCGDVDKVSVAVATVRTELRESVAELKIEVADVRNELRESVAELRADIASLRAAIEASRLWATGEFNGLRSWIMGLTAVVSINTLATFGILWHLLRQ